MRGSQEGFSMLILVVVISSVGLILAITASRIGMRQADLGIIHSEGARARNVAQSCMEEALIRVFSDTGYSAENAQFDTIGGTCRVTVSGDTDKQITVKGGFGEGYAVLTAQVQIESGRVQVTGWDED